MRHSFGKIVIYARNIELLSLLYEEHHSTSIDLKGKSGKTIKLCNICFATNRSGRMKQLTTYRGSAYLLRVHFERRKPDHGQIII
ncbi:CLUMA_CG001080, isoform A [Clunio marinus]|uniref:CLUMA_CG001080, isoform A n=1 Tax=Clunio marinus TaxID=568069 RepID=A0A1J1HLF1_9DIPT|nr:CLUMA_CG001080, isoform A [Clunio marinus]